jgi:hypothetical protein
MIKPYVLSAKIWNRLHASGMSLICPRCGLPIIIGEAVINKSKGAKSRWLYHAACYEAMFVDIPDDENEEEKA